VKRTAHGRTLQPHATFIMVDASRLLTEIH
jgi:hypothetical protein